MTTPIDEARLAAHLAPRFAAEHVDPSYLRFVVLHVTRPDVTWRTCCGSQCDPCVERLGRLVDAARDVLGIARDGH